MFFLLCRNVSHVRFLSRPLPVIIHNHHTIRCCTTDAAEPALLSELQEHYSNLVLTRCNWFRNCLEVACRCFSYLFCAPRLTGLLSLWNRVFLDMLIVAQLAKQFAIVYRTKNPLFAKFRCVILSQVSWIHSILTQFILVRSVLIFASLTALRCRDFLPENFQIKISYAFLTLLIHSVRWRPSYSWYERPNNLFGVELELLGFSSCYFLHRTSSSGFQKPFFR